MPKRKKPREPRTPMLMELSYAQANEATIVDEMDGWFGQI
jgi:hypothetical protein